MSAHTLANGWTIIWTALEFTSGLMGASTTANTKMTRNTGSESTHGRTVAVMKAIGLEENNMDLGLTKYPKMGS